MISPSLTSLQQEFENLCHGLDTQFKGDTEFFCNISKESQMNINDLATDHQNPFQVQNLILCCDMLSSYLNLIEHQVNLLDFHADNMPLFIHRDEAFNYMKAYDLIHDINDAHQVDFEGHLKNFECALTEGYSDFAYEHRSLLKSFNDVAYNGQAREWNISYHAFLNAYRDSSVDLSSKFISYARFNAGIIKLDIENIDADTLLPCIEAGLDDAKEHLECAKIIDSHLQGQSTRFLQPSHIVPLNSLRLTH